MKLTIFCVILWISIATIPGAMLRISDSAESWKITKHLYIYAIVSASFMASILGTINITKKKENFILVNGLLLRPNLTALCLLPFLIPMAGLIILPVFTPMLLLESGTRITFFYIYISSLILMAASNIISILYLNCEKICADMIYSWSADGEMVSLTHNNRNFNFYKKKAPNLVNWLSQFRQT